MRNVSSARSSRWDIALAATVFITAVLPSPGPAQQGTARLRGLVFDSTEMRPLPGARVAVLGTPVIGNADTTGHFDLPGVPPGSWWVSFFHPRLQALGVSPPSSQVTFAPDATVEMELAVPSERTLLLGWCLAEQPGPQFGAVAGVVRDSLTGVALPGTLVTATPFQRGLGDLIPLETRTDEAGYYRFCSLPAGLEARIQPRFGRNVGVPVSVVPEARGAVLRDLLMPLSAEGTLAGTVLDFSTRAPLPGAMVSALGTGLTALSASDGRFLLEDLPPGRHLIHTEYLGYAPRTDSVTVFSQETVDIEVRLTTAAIPIEGLVVTARTRFGRTSLATDKRADVLTRAEIEPILARVQNMGDLLRAMRAPGLRVSEVMVSGAGGVVVPGLCVEVTRRTTRAPGGCVQAAIFINNLHTPFPDQALMALDPTTIDRIEVLSPFDAQFQFGDVGVNGAVLIFTR